jgi:hypothetical protein
MSFPWIYLIPDLSARLYGNLMHKINVLKGTVCKRGMTLGMKVFIQNG